MHVSPAGYYLGGLSYLPSVRLRSLRKPNSDKLTTRERHNRGHQERRHEQGTCLFVWSIVVFDSLSRDGAFRVALRVSKDRPCINGDTMLGRPYAPLPLPATQHRPVLGITAIARNKYFHDLNLQIVP
jgi:hypothetical protein